jgi:hypothetical protein
MDWRLTMIDDVPAVTALTIREDIIAARTITYQVCFVADGVQQEFAVPFAKTYAKDVGQDRFKDQVKMLAAEVARVNRLLTVFVCDNCLREDDVRLDVDAHGMCVRCLSGGLDTAVHLVKK